MHVSFDAASAHRDAVAGGALVYSRLHERLLHASAEAAKLETVSVLQHRAALSGRQEPSAQLTIDSAAEMAAVLAACAPRAAATARPPRTLPVAGRDSLPLPTRRPATSATSASLANSSPYIRELVSRMEGGDVPRPGRAGAGPSATTAPAPSLTPGPLAGDVGRTTALSDGPREESVGGWVRRRAAPATNARARSAADARPRPLLAELMAGRFPLPRAPVVCRGSWLPRAPSEVGQCSSPPILMTEVALAPSAERPAVPLQPEGGEGSEPPAITDADLLERLRQEPVRSFRVICDATSRPASALIARSRANLEGLSDSGAIARENLSRGRQLFEHSRYAKQAELLSFLDWRGACRAAVSRDAVHSAADARRPPAEGRPHASGWAQTSAHTVPAGDVLDAVGRTEGFMKRWNKRPPPTTTPPAGRRRHSAPTMQAGGQLSSMWTRAAAVHTAEQLREELCDRLAAFTLNFPAAALSRESMETLRAEVIAQVRRTPPPGLFSSADLRAFLARRQDLGGAGGLSSRASVVAVADLVDAMPSPAEAAFVRHAFDTLP